MPSGGLSSLLQPSATVITIPLQPSDVSLAIILMFAGLGIIGVLSSYLASTFVSLQRRRETKIDEGNGNGENKDENEERQGNDEDETSNLKAQLAAMEVELTEIKGLLEKMYQVQ